MLSSTAIRHTCVQAVGTSPSGSHQNQQLPFPRDSSTALAVPRPLQTLEPSELPAASLVLGLPLRVPGRAQQAPGKSQTCQERLEQHRGFCSRWSQASLLRKHRESRNYILGKRSAAGNQQGRFQSTFLASLSSTWVLLENMLPANHALFWRAHSCTPNQQPAE